MALVDDLAKAFRNAGMSSAHARKVADLLDGAAALTAQPALTAADASTVDAVYGAEEVAVINNLRTRVNELEARLRTNGLLI